LFIFDEEAPMEKLALSIREAAEALGLHPDTVRGMVETGQLPAVRVGVGKGKWIIARQALDDLFQVA
jgi:excisionase family DNA binding protein